jgi:hypothetical protein
MHMMSSEVVFNHNIYMKFLNVLYGFLYTK